MKNNIMKNKEQFVKTNRVAVILGSALVVALTMGVGTVKGQNVMIQATPPAIAPAAVVQDDYVYYPHYGVYYNHSRHQYYYMKNNAWVVAPAPEGVTADVLFASPSVHMDFHDSPSRHHTDMLKRYPRNWAPPGDHRDNDHDKK
jgi:hypothetical protein